MDFVDVDVYYVFVGIDVLVVGGVVGVEVG